MYLVPEMCRTINLLVVQSWNRCRSRTNKIVNFDCVACRANLPLSLPRYHVMPRLRVFFIFLSTRKGLLLSFSLFETHMYVREYNLTQVQSTVSAGKNFTRQYKYLV